MDAASLLIFSSILTTIWIPFGLRKSVAKDRDSHPDQIMTFATALVGAWVVVVTLVGTYGWVSSFKTAPPSMMLFILFSLIAVVLFCQGPWGKLLSQKISLGALVLFQSFRLLAEAALLLAWREGLAPIQLTLHGYNFDIVTGVLAVVIGVFLYLSKNAKANLIAAWIFNVVGIVLLLNIMFIAITSFPTPLQIFHIANTWVTKSPYILLPGILVPCALGGHILLTKKLFSLRKQK